ncbi:MAG: aspartyl/asparaginyl beta-hydroxylase domain-containing protein, partial [Algicola sp.]|nr:aspartyl/asparaginyl beta-hydroxylase domain-containing protein [Algicola sp.]
MNFKTKQHFPFLQALEDNWQVIFDEYLAVKNQLVDWPEKDLYNAGWEAFGIFDWPSGDELPSAALCPKTKELIKQLLPNHGATGFSRLGPGTLMTPHTRHAGP